MPENSLWVERYRPKEVSEIVMADDYKTFFNKCITDGVIPNLLFTGPPGSGKTTLARILCDKIIFDDSDILIMNGSDTTGVDTYRNKITGFLKSPPLRSKIKIIFVDEFDYTTANAQAILRNIIEEYYENVRFICTGNYLSKIIEPLQSRFQHFRFEKLSDEFISKFVEEILEKEKVKYKKKDIDVLVRSLSPDVRKIINTAQRHVIDGSIKGLNADEISTAEKKLIGLILEICDHVGTPNEKATFNKNMTTIQKVLSGDKEPDYRFIYEELFKSKLPVWGKIKVNKSANEHISSAIPSIHFEAMVLEIFVAGRNYVQMFEQQKMK